MNNLIKYFNRLLLNNDELLRYLEDRGIGVATIKEFKLGKFPSDIRNIFKYSDGNELVDSGIVYNTMNGFESVFVVNKLIIPIYDSYGESIAIAGRTLVDDGTMKKHKIPKYINSKYMKTHHLYGLNKSKDYIREKNEAIVVEGYFDFISAFKSGIKNIVATSGTLLSNVQINLLSRYTNNITILLDNDNAGERATDRIKKRINGKRRIVVNYVKMLEFKDLDELIRSGKEVKDFIVR